MRTKTAIRYFGSRSEIARILDISRAAVSKWGPVVPEGSAYKLESKSDGKCKVIPSLYQVKRASMPEARTA